MDIAVHFGAGAIGRGLLGDLLYESGYKIVFVDTATKLIDQINESNSYELIEMELNNHRKTIDNVSALNSIEQTDDVVNTIADAVILTTSVRVENLKRIAPVIGQGLLKRLESNKNPINVLSFENAYRASDILKDEIIKCTKELNNKNISKVACFANTITDRVVMNIEENGKSVIQVGDSFEAAVEQNALYDPNSRPIKDSVYTNNIDLSLDRKLFIVNGGHCSCGYLGNLKKYTIMMDGFEDYEIYNQVRDEMREVGYMLSVKHKISFKDLEKYIEFALERYLTSKNVDYVARVCRNPIRKLNPKDRLVGPALQAEKLELPFDNIAKSIAAVFMFYSKEDEESIRIQDFIKNQGIENAITEFTSIEKDSSLFKAVLKHYETFEK